MDEHRIGLKPIVRGVWAPVGERPIAPGNHRFEWLYVTGFVEPASGHTMWNIANAVCKETAVSAGSTKLASPFLDARRDIPRRRSSANRGASHPLL
jgi:hypothetical protein